MIEVQQLTKRYGPFTAVDGVSFNVGKGEILGFLGPNGAGKTTTMRILTGYMPPTEGRARVAGFDLQEQPVEAKLRIGYLPETPPLYPDMTVREYLRFVARIKGVPAGEQAARVAAVMQRTHVADMANRHCGKLSKGYRQRVGLAQALIHNPDVLVLDEPTAGLDPKQIIETRELIRSLGGDHTIVLSTHILPEVAQTCQRVVIINKGRVVAEDTPENLTAACRAPRPCTSKSTRRALTRRPCSPPSPASPASRSPPGTAPATGFEVQSEKGLDVRRSVAQAVVGAGLGLVELRPMRMSLEEIFLQLTTTDAPSEEVARA